LSTLGSASVVGGHKVLCQEKCDGFGASAKFPGFATARISFFRGYIVQKGQQFASAEEVLAKATRALSEVSKNGLQECLQKLYEHWQTFITAKGNCFEKVLCQ
jgi:hypothetical protein